MPYRPPSRGVSQDRARHLPPLTSRVYSVFRPFGATVTWINQDDVPHAVVSTDRKDIRSPVLDTEEKFTHTFAHAGSCPYYCSIHPKMTGKVIVK